MAAYRRFNIYLSITICVICFAIFVDVCATVTEPGRHESFENFNISTLQRLIYASRHFPVCVILRNQGCSPKLESRLLKFWTTKDSESNFSAWKIGIFNVDKVIDPQILLPKQLPTLRCYLGFASPFDFNGRVSVNVLRKWFLKLSVEHADQLEEATSARVDEMVSRPGLTLIGFSGYQKHYEIEELLLQVRDKWRDQLNVLFVHPHSPDVRFLADKYKIRNYPSAVLVENSASTDQSPVTRRTFSPGQMTHQHIYLYLTARSFPALKLTISNFEDVVIDLTKYYVPIVICFYLETSQHALQYLYALQRTIESFRDNEIDVRFGLVEVNFDTRLIMEKWVTFAYTTKFPFTVLFHPRWQHGAVVEIQQTLLPDRPTVSVVLRALRSQHLTLKTKGGITVDFQPWGLADPDQVSQLFEGPRGLMCSIYAHNQTDNFPRSYPVKQTKKTHQTKARRDKQKRRFGAWHQQFDSAVIDSRLHRVGTLPVATEDSWAGVIEKSHAPNHPFYPGNRWRGEFTKVALVVFIITDCGSCQRNMAMFKELQKMVTNIDGSSLYLVNCTSDPRLCERLKVQGFPSVCAFRGLGWLHGERCLSAEAGQRVTPVKMAYHGVLEVAAIMEWFSGVAAAEAVKNVRFEPLSNDTTREDVRLVGTLIPRLSRYLPHVSKAVMADYFYPYECLRLACERLYGQIACYVQYSKDIPRSEFSNEDQDMIVAKVLLQRRDGLSATVARLGRTLASILEEEADSSIHILHHPHKYDLPPNLKCETDHAACTDLIVQFTIDHARLPITHMSAASFHMFNSLIFQEELPVLVTLVHQDNITADSQFYSTLQHVATKLYNDIVVVTVDVDQYSAWSGQFVPRNYAAQVHVKKELPLLYVYPRFCIVNWTDHHHAAFHPSVSTPIPADPFTEASITQFVERVLLDPQHSMMETEHF